MEGTDLGGEQQFCLRWNNFQANITSQFETLRDDEDFVDVTLACEGQRLEAHKVVLSACSPYFKELFKNNPCPHPIIFMRDCELVHIAALLEFMYAGEVNISQTQLSSFLKTAEALQIRGLTDSAEKNDSKPPTVKHQSSQLRNLLCGRQQTSPAKDTCQNVNETKDTYHKTVKHYSQSRRAARVANEASTPLQPYNGISDRNVFTNNDTGNNKCDTVRALDSGQTDYQYKLDPHQTTSNDNETMDVAHINPFALTAVNTLHGEFQHEMLEPKLEIPDYTSDDEIKPEKTFNAENLFGADGNQSFLNIQGDVAGPSQLVKCENEGCGLDFSKKTSLRRSWLSTSSDIHPDHSKHDLTPPKLIKLGEGIELLEEQIRAVKWADYRKLTRSLAALLFSPAELATCSVTGQRWSRAGLEERPTKPPLDRHKVQAIISYVSRRFPLVEVSRIKQVLAYKCKENCTALRMKSASDTMSQQSGGSGLDPSCTATDLFSVKH